MQPALTFCSHGRTQAILGAGADPVGGVHDSIPLHPEDKHPGFDEFKQKKKRTPHPSHPSEPTEGTHPDSGHQIDEYA